MYISCLLHTSRARGLSLGHSETVGESLRSDRDAIAVLDAPRGAPVAVGQQRRDTQLGESHARSALLREEQRSQARIALPKQPFGALRFESLLGQNPSSNAPRHCKDRRGDRYRKSNARRARPPQEALTDFLGLLC